jgi:hypothetical protein
VFWFYFRCSGLFTLHDENGWSYERAEHWLCGEGQPGFAARSYAALSELPSLSMAPRQRLLDRYSGRHAVWRAGGQIGCGPRCRTAGAFRGRDQLRRPEVA